MAKNTVSKVEIYEKRSEPLEEGEYIEVRSHFEDGEKVVLVFDDHQIAVDIDDLLQGIAACQY